MAFASFTRITLPFSSLLFISPMPIRFRRQLMMPADEFSLAITPFHDTACAFSILEYADASHLAMPAIFATPETPLMLTDLPLPAAAYASAAAFAR
jgi:hypothetical protein